MNETGYRPRHDSEQTARRPWNYIGRHRPETVLRSAATTPHSATAAGHDTAELITVSA